MHPHEFHRRRYDLLSNIVIGFEDLQAMADLYFEAGQAEDQKLINEILDDLEKYKKAQASFKPQLKESWEYYVLKESWEYCDKHGLLKKSELQLTPEQWMLYDRSTVIAKIFYPVTRLFNSIFKMNMKV